MKKILLGILKEHKAECITYSTYRSDMGMQVYDILYKLPGIGKQFTYSDSYPAGQKGGKEAIERQFRREIIQNCIQYKP